MTCMKQKDSWVEDLERFQNEEKAQMEALQLEVIKKNERDRAELLESIARLEGSMSATTKVEQAHVYDLLSIVRDMVEKQYE